MSNESENEECNNCGEKLDGDNNVCQCFICNNCGEKVPENTELDDDFNCCHCKGDGE